MVRAFIRLPFTSVKEVNVKRDVVEVVLNGGVATKVSEMENSVAIGYDEYRGRGFAPDFLPVVYIRKGGQAHKKLI